MILPIIGLGLGAGWAYHRFTRPQASVSKYKDPYMDDYDLTDFFVPASLDDDDWPTPHDEAQWNDMRIKMLEWDAIVAGLEADGFHLDLPEE